MPHGECQSGDRGARGKHGLIVVFMGGDWQGRVSRINRFRIGFLE